jgi:hypothetical protein
MVIDEEASSGKGQILISPKKLNLVIVLHRVSDSAPFRLCISLLRTPSALVEDDGGGKVREYASDPFQGFHKMSTAGDQSNET